MPDLAALRRKARRLDASIGAVLSLVAVAVFAVLAFHAVDAWRHRDDVGVDFDHRPYRGPGPNGRAASPDGHRFTAFPDGNLLVVNRTTREVEASIEADEAIFVTDDVLVVFNSSGLFDGTAVVDLAERSVDQVPAADEATRDTFHPISVREDGTVEVCESVRYYLEEQLRCLNRQRFVIDPATARMSPA